MYGKLIDGKLRGAPMPLKTEQGDVFTNNPSIYLANGYKPIILMEYPSDGKSYIDSWTEAESEITQIWIEQLQTDEIPNSEALSIITERDVQT